MTASSATWFAPHRALFGFRHAARLVRASAEDPESPDAAPASARPSPTPRFSEAPSRPPPARRSALPGASTASASTRSPSGLRGGQRSARPERADRRDSRRYQSRVEHLDIAISQTAGSEGHRPPAKRARKSIRRCARLWARPHAQHPEIADPQCLSGFRRMPNCAWCGRMFFWSPTRTISSSTTAPTKSCCSRSARSTIPTSPLTMFNDRVRDGNLRRLDQYILDILITRACAPACRAQGPRHAAGDHAASPRVCGEGE